MAESAQQSDSCCSITSPGMMPLKFIFQHLSALLWTSRGTYSCLSNSQHSILCSASFAFTRDNRHTLMKWIMHSISLGIQWFINDQKKKKTQISGLSDSSLLWRVNDDAKDPVYMSSGGSKENSLTHTEIKVIIMINHPIPKAIDCWYFGPFCPHYRKTRNLNFTY